MKRFIFIFFLILFFLNLKFQIKNSSVFAQTITPTPDASWPMTAHDPQRTSWTPEQPADNLSVEWYRPIDAYIPPNFQAIAANNLVYVSSSRGLYVFYVTDPDGTGPKLPGDLAWRYDTELPLGNSPTVATVTINGTPTSVAFVGGYDKKIHAFNAQTGTPLWESPQAKAGFDANPLVINNTVYVGNRDGYFYAYNASAGSLIWQYPQGGQDGIGPIHQSPAYKNNTLYFVTDYNFAYALNMDGTLKWKSPKLPGDGYDTYWPVIYTEPASNKDYVILSGKIPYREFMKPGACSKNADCLYSYDGHELSAFPQQVSLPDAWAQGKTVLDYTVLENYYRQNPEEKIYTVLEGSSGNEYSQNGTPFYFPVLPMAGPSSQAPPVIDNDFIFISSIRFPAIGRHHIMGWKFGTPYFVDTPLEGASDETILLSAGDKNIYKVLDYYRSADYTSLPNLATYKSLWPYTEGSLSAIAPGFDDKIFYLQPGVLANYTGIFGNVNGVYGYNGHNSPIVPYKGKLFTIKANSILAFGTGTARGKLALLTSIPQTQTFSVLTDTEFKNRLEKEVQKIVSAGILKPGYMDDAMFGAFYNLLDNYFDNPGDTLYTLSIAYPYLSDTTKLQVKNYLKNTFIPRYYQNPLFQNNLVYRIGWKDGAKRDSIPYTTSLTADMQTLDDNYDWHLDGSLTWFYPLYFYTNPNNFYAFWKYVQNIAPEDTQTIYQIALNILTTGRCQWSDCTVVPTNTWDGVTTGATDATLIQKPYELNAYIAGYQGFVNLAQLVGVNVTDSYCNTHQSDTQCKVKTELARLKNLRLNNFSKDTPFTNFNDWWGKGLLNISRNFLWMTPELAADLRSSKLTAVQQALNEYNTVAPYWFVSRFNAAVTEGGFQNLYDYSSNFQARAWILKSSKEELSKYLDVPAFEKGDLFYIQNLVAVIEAPSSGPSPSLGPTLTPVPNPACNADIVKNGTVDQSDLLAILNNYGTNNSAYDISFDNKVNSIDASYILVNWLATCP